MPSNKYLSDFTEENDVEHLSPKQIIELAREHASDNNRKDIEKVINNYYHGNIIKHKKKVVLTTNPKSKHYLDILKKFIKKREEGGKVCGQVF